MRFRINSADYTTYDDMLEHYPELKEFEVEREIITSPYLGGKTIVRNYACITIITLEQLEKLNTSVGHDLIVDFPSETIIIYDNYLEQHDLLQTLH